MKTAVRINEVVKTFGRTRAVDGISFEIPKGRVFGVLGPNGAGKTTLFSLMAGFLKPTEGNIEVLGVDIENISELRGKLSILPQDAQFASNVPILEQLIFFSQLNGNARDQAEEDAQKALAVVGLSEKAKKNPRTLSHGMFKRLGIAQAFLGHPEVIILDEPTAGLDPAAAQAIRDLIAKLRGNATLIVSSHDLDEIQAMCDDVAILDEGKVVELSSVADVTHAGSHTRMEFSQPLSDAQLADIRSVPGVSDCVHERDAQYTIVIDSSDADKDKSKVTADIVGKLAASGTIPRSVQEGVALQDRFLEVTRRQGWHDVE